MSPVIFGFLVFLSHDMAYFLTDFNLCEPYLHAAFSKNIYILNQEPTKIVGLQNVPTQNVPAQNEPINSNSIISNSINSNSENILSSCDQHDCIQKISNNDILSFSKGCEYYPLPSLRVVTLLRTICLHLPMCSLPKLPPTFFVWLSNSK